MNVIKTMLPDVFIFEPKAFQDNRGYFFESWNLDTYKKVGLDYTFVQDNISFSHKHVLRGLHGQNPHSQGKLVTVLKGKVFDVAVDIRVGSPHFGKWVGEILSDENHRQLFIPPGFAHGFLVLSDDCIFQYKCTDYYNPKGEFTLCWNDPQINISWPIESFSPIISEKDKNGYKLSDIPKSLLVKF